MESKKSLLNKLLEHGGRIPLTMACMALLGFIVIIVFGFNDSHNFIINVSQCFILGLSSATLGTFVGFLFGIPKQTAKNVEGRYTSNTNLEEISDWLTKILVGLGLTQLSAIPTNFQSLINNLSNSILDVPKNMIGSIIIYFLIIGFFSGYLITRLYLSGEFAKAEDKLRDLSEKLNKFSTKKEESVLVDDQTNQFKELLNTEDILDREIEKPVGDIIIQTKQLEADGIIIPPAQYFKQGRLMVLNQNYDTAREYFQKSYEAEKHYKSGNNLAVVLSRFMGKHAEAEKVLKELISSHPQNPFAYYNLACNYVRLGNLDLAMENLKKCINIAKDSFLNEAKKDSTFEPLREREDFKELVPGYVH